MANISEHYTKEEGECHTGKKGWINFLIERYPVCVHYILINLGESVGFDVRRRLYLVIVNFLNLQGELVILAVVIRHSQKFRFQPMLLKMRP